MIADEQILELLKPFCSTDPHRSVMHNTWHEGGMTMATDGRILVAADGIYGEQSSNHLGGLSLLEREWKGLTDEYWVEIGELPEIKKWPLYPKQECRNCNGFGEVTLYDDDLNEYVCDCRTCGGSGNVADKTKGPVGFDAEQTPTRIGKKVIDAALLEKIAALPGVLVWEDPKHDPLKPLPVKWAHGRGLLMPMKLSGGAE